jgi:hypothetical protein
MRGAKLKGNVEKYAFNTNLLSCVSNVPHFSSAQSYCFLNYSHANPEMFSTACVHIAINPINLFRNAIPETFKGVPEQSL